MASNYWICVDGNCVATTHTLTWAMHIAEAMGRDLTLRVPVTVNDYQGKTVYTV